MALKDVIIGYAKGDKGDKGDTGERGATGQTGPQGEPGNIADAAITDTQGLDVAKGAKTTAQKLFDAIADRIVNKLVTNDTLTTKLADYLLKSAMSSTNIDSTTNVPTSALVYSLMQDVNNNLSNKFKITADNGYTQLSQLMDVGAWSEPFVFDIPYTSSLAPASNNAVGIAERGMLHAFDYAGKHFYCIDASKGWQKSPYALKSDLLNLSRTFVSGDSFSDAKDLSIPPGIYGVNPGLKNIPENTYGLLEVTADTVNNWRFLKFTPTNIKSHYLMFYNGYDKTWSEWAHFASTT